MKAETIDPPHTIRATVREVLRLSPAHAWLLPLLVALGLAASLAESLGISLIVLFLYSAMDRAGEAAAASGIIGDAFAMVMAKTGGGATLAVLILGMVLANIALTFIYALISAAARYRLSEKVRNRLNRQFLEVSYDFILRHDQGQLLNIWAGESWSMGEMYLCACRILINTSSALIFVLFLLVVSWKLLLVTAPGMVLLLAAMHGLSRPARNLGRRMRTEHENLAERMLVMLQGMRALRAFGQEQRYRHGFETASEQVRQTSISFERLNALVAPSVQIGYFLLLVAIILVSRPLGVSFAATLAFVALLYRLQPHVRDLESNLVGAAQLEASARSVIRMLDRSDKTYLTAGTASFGGLHQDIRFELGVLYLCRRTLTEPR